MLHKSKSSFLIAFLCLQTCLISLNSFAQQTDTLFFTHKIDGVIDIAQLNDSLLVGLYSEFPQFINQNYVSSVDSVLVNYVVINLNTKQIKKIPFKGNDSTIVSSLAGSSFVYAGDFYFMLRDYNRDNFTSTFFSSIQGQISPRILYKSNGDSIQKVTDLFVNHNLFDINPLSFVNLNGNIINTVSFDLTSKYVLTEYDFNGNLLAISDTIFSPIIHGITQNSIDSSYLLFFANNTVTKLDKNFNTVNTSVSLKENNTGRYLDMSYFNSHISDKPFLSGILNPIQFGDSICIASVQLINDSTFKAHAKKLILFDNGFINYSNYVYNSFFNGDNIDSNRFYYAYQTNDCNIGSTNCISKFKVICQDTLNNILWENEFGGDAGYSISRVLALKDSSCIVLVHRTNSTTGNVDMHYVYINKDGDIVPGFLDVLGLDELEIPMKETFSVFPNPANATLSINNQKLENKAVQLMISDLSGKLVIEQAFEKTIDISGLEQGTYLYSVKDINGHVSSTKFIKTDQ